MKVLWAIVVAFGAVLAAIAGTLGSFAGTVVTAPSQSGPWLYVEGHDHGIRRVNVSTAKIRYDDEVPAAERHDPVPTTLPAGTYVRVLAEQGPDGEWKATEVDILKPGTGHHEKKIDSPVTAET
ncbi:MAG TPA: hypothetical protein VGL89_16150 [Candidatus Koribacter sp.]|jgi:hypothetical protein